MADAKKLMKNAGLQISLLCDTLNEWPGKSRPIPEVTVRKWISDFSQGKGVGGFNGSKIEKAFSFLFSSSPDTPELLVRFAALDTKLIRFIDQDEQTYNRALREAEDFVKQFRKYVKAREDKVMILRTAANYRDMAKAAMANCAKSGIPVEELSLRSDGAKKIYVALSTPEMHDVVKNKIRTKCWQQIFDQVYVTVCLQPDQLDNFRRTDQQNKTKHLCIECWLYGDYKSREQFYARLPENRLIALENKKADGVTDKESNCDRLYYKQLSSEHFQEELEDFLRNDLQTISRLVCSGRE